MFDKEEMVKKMESVQVEKEKNLIDLAEKYYLEYRTFISYEKLPKIDAIKICSLDKIDARVFITDREIILEVSKKFTKKNMRQFYKAILFHEFTHIWDRVTGYYDEEKAPNITEYHAVQIELAENLGLNNLNELKNFSYKQKVWNENEQIRVGTFIEDTCNNFSYLLEYYYYRESQDRVEQFMYYLSQWLGYSIFFERYCMEWNNAEKLNCYIPDELRSEIKELHDALFQNKNKEEVGRIYEIIENKFKMLNDVDESGTNNYFLQYQSDLQKEDAIFIERCNELECIYEDMKKKRGKGFNSKPYLEKSFVYEYFKKIYYGIKLNKMLYPDNPKTWDYFLKYFTKENFETDTDQNIFINELGEIIEHRSFFKIIHKKLLNFRTVEICRSDGNNNYFKILNLNEFIIEFRYTGAFLAALLKAMENGGYCMNICSDGVTITIPKHMKDYMGDDL